MHFLGRGGNYHFPVKALIMFRHDDSGFVDNLFLAREMYELNR